MTRAQLNKYNAEWGQVYSQLRAQGYTPKEAKAQRHALTAKALGHNKSSKDFTNDDFDLVRAEFHAILHSDDLDGLLAIQNQPSTRRFHAIQKLCERLGEDWHYAESIAKQMTRQRLNAPRLEEMNLRDLDNVIIKLKRQAARTPASTPDCPF